MDEAIRFFLEVFAIVILGASYSIYIESELQGQLCIIIGIILLLLSKWKKKKESAYG